MSTSPHPRIGILADDLTSAADGAGPFVRHGLTATVGRRHVPTCAANVIAVDTRTRSMSEADAITTVSGMTKALRSADILYKTVDSTLRGHVRSEIGAASAASGRATVVFAPAFPAAGRVTRDGIQFVDGVPVAESRYAHDPVHPARTSDLSDLVSAVDRPVIVLDAQTQDELNAGVAAISDPHSVLWIGSPGMAEALARTVGLPQTPTLPGVCESDVLIIVGSANTVSHAQADEAGGAERITVLRAPLERSADNGATLRALTAQAVRALQGGGYGAVLATGGDTMEAVLDALQIASFDLQGNFEPGFPVVTADWAGRRLVLGMKAGGFGSPSTLLQAANHLMNQQERIA